MTSYTTSRQGPPTRRVLDNLFFKSSNRIWHQRDSNNNGTTTRRNSPNSESMEPFEPPLPSTSHLLSNGQATAKKRRSVKGNIYVLPPVSHCVTDDTINDTVEYVDQNSLGKRQESNRYIPFNFQFNCQSPVSFFRFIFIFVLVFF